MVCITGTSILLDSLVSRFYVNFVKKAKKKNILNEPKKKYYDELMEPTIKIIIKYVVEYIRYYIVRS